MGWGWGLLTRASVFGVDCFCLCECHCRGTSGEVQARGTGSFSDLLWVAEGCAGSAEADQGADGWGGERRGENSAGKRLHELG